MQIENSKNIVNNTINNNTNTNSNNTTNINNTYNIVLNKHNCENMDYINDTIKIRIIESSLGSILKLIEEKHFNKERPENSNVYIYIYIYIYQIFVAEKLINMTVLPGLPKKVLI